MKNQASKFHFRLMLFITTSILIVPSFSVAQTKQFGKGQSDYSLGIGLISTLGSTLEGAGFQTQTAMPPISFTADFATGDYFSLGGYIGIAKDNLTYSDYWGDQLHGSVSHFIIGMGGLWHFELSEQLDTYGGGMLGYNAAKLNVENSYGKVKSFTYRLLVGTRYHFSENFGAFMELGYGVSVVILGITLRNKGVGGASDEQPVHGHRKYTDD